MILARFKGLALLAAAGILSGYSSSRSDAAPFTAGNLAVYRVGVAGDGSNVGSAGEPVFIDEYTTSGTLVQSFPMPLTVLGNQRRLIASGTNSAEGLVNRSPDGQWLTFMGYDAAVGTTSLPSRSPTDVKRVVGRMDAYGNLDTSTALSDLGNSPRSAITNDGVSILVTAASGPIRQANLGETSSTVYSSTTLSGMRHIDIFDHRLFVSTNSSTAAAVIAEVNQATGQHVYFNGLPAPSLDRSVSQFWMADLSAAVRGLDVLYLTDQSSTDDSGGLRKYSLVDGTWVDNGRVVGPASPLPFISNFIGLTGAVTDAEVTLYATRSSSVGSSLISFVDASGHNGAFNGTANLLADAPANTRFRGVDFAPVAAAGGIPGDFNNDSVVTGADLAQWKGDYGIDAGSDADGDGDSDGNDFLTWQLKLGIDEPVTAIPEPASGILASLAIVAAFRRPRDS